MTNASAFLVFGMLPLIISTKAGSGEHREIGAVQPAGKLYLTFTDHSIWCYEFPELRTNDPKTHRPDKAILPGKHNSQVFTPNEL